MHSSACLGNLGKDLEKQSLETHYYFGNTVLLEGDKVGVVDGTTGG